MRRSTLLLTAVPAAVLVAVAVLAEPRAASVAPQAPAPLPVDLHAMPSLTGLEGVTAQGDIGLTATLDRSSVLMGTDGTVRAEVTLTSHHSTEGIPRVPTDLVVVIDASGSMEGAKIEEARHAAAELIGGLTDADRFALVRYSGSAIVEIPLSVATAEARSSWSRQVAGIQANGSTNMQAGLDVGGALHSPQPGRARRTILISDGLPDSPHGLIDQARGSARAETPLTTVGIGDDYDERLMSQLADAGTGNFYWVRQGQDLAAVFADEFSTASETVASGLTIQHSPLGGARLVSAAGYEVVDGGFSVGSLFAGQERRLWLTFQVPADTAVEDLQLGQLTATWRTPDQTIGAGSQVAGLNLPAVSVVDDPARYVASIDADAWGRSVVTEEYNAMRAEVSRRVQAGDRNGALALIDSYATGNEAMNEQVNCQEVWDNLDETAQLRQDVEANFTGEDQRDRQNIFSKALNMDAYSERRVGQAKSY